MKQKNKQTNNKSKKVIWLVIMVLLLPLPILFAYLFFNKRKKGDTGSSSSVSGVFKEARGWRNKNPLNIRVGNDWKGESTSQTDEKNFEVFSHFKWGYRAAFKLMNTYASKYGLTRLSGVINRWAPSSNGNNPTSYIQNVADIMKKDGYTVNENTTVKLKDLNFMVSLLRAMTIIENGWKYEKKINNADIIDGINLA